MKHVPLQALLGLAAGVLAACLPGEAPAQAPRQVVDTMHKAAVAALKDPGTLKRLEAAGFVRIGYRPDDLADFMRVEVDKFTKLIRAIGLRPE